MRLIKRMLVFAAAGAVAILGTASAAPPRTVQVTISAMAYTTPELSVSVGDRVEWINNDIVDHTSTEKRSALWNVSIAPGKRMTVVMKQAGTFDYYCRYHPNMTAKVVVGRARR